MATHEVNGVGSRELAHQDECKDWVLLAPGIINFSPEEK